MKKEEARIWAALKGSRPWKGVSIKMNKNVKEKRGSPEVIPKKQATLKKQAIPKKQITPLNQEQQQLVEKHLSVVHFVIINSIHINETIYGFGYDDLFQEGCIWLCHAAATYDKNLACFATYAKKVVRNGLISYCRRMCCKQKRFQYLMIGEHGELMADGKALTELAEEMTEQLAENALMDLLKSCKQDYEGVARLGIEALEWKIKGMELREIAAIYHVPSTHVGAWISRSAEKLKKNERFLQGILS